MGQITGRNGAVKIGSTTIAELANWSIDFGLETAGERVYDDNGWMPVAGVIGQGWTATVDGFIDDEDTDGQVWLINTAFSGTKITNLSFYETATTYWDADTDLDEDAGAFISGLSIGIPRGGVATISFSVAGDGPIKRTIG
jgi:hypothetical protein